MSLLFVLKVALGQRYFARCRRNNKAIKNNSYAVIMFQIPAYML